MIQKLKTFCVKIFEENTRKISVVPGCGYVETFIYKSLLETTQLNQQEKEIYKYFAETFLIIPKILIENCNEKTQFLIPLLLLNIGRGIDKNGKIMDVDVMESLLVKKYIYLSSLEIFKALFNVNCVISDQLSQRYLKTKFQ